MPLTPEQEDAARKLAEAFAPSAIGQMALWSTHGELRLEAYRLADGNPERAAKIARFLIDGVIDG